MASGTNELYQHRPNIEARIRTLVNNDLKEICKAHNQQVSGTKAILQRRVTQILDSILASGDAGQLETFRYRLANHGVAPPTGHTLGGSGGGAGYQSSSMAPRSMPKPASAASAAGLQFKPSPFYRIVENVTRPQDLPEMPQNRHTVSTFIKLSDDHIRLLKEDKNIRVMIYCAQYLGGINPYTVLDVAFPNQIEVKVNSDEVKANFKGLKNKPGSTKPADITDKLRKTSGYNNPLSLCYALTTKRFQFVVALVEHISWEELTKRPHRQIQRQTVVDEMNKANADPDIAATSVKMSLKDPVSTMRINIPVRATICSHNQCFDMAMFMQLQEQAPTWQCPICSKTVSYDSLCVDKYFEEILSVTSKDVEQVTIEPNGSWSVDKDDEDKGKSNHAKGEARAAYDDDFEDDDLVEVMDPPAKQEPNGLKREFPQAAVTAISTPPLSAASREASIMSAQRPASGNKRPANAVIDLTLSDDDEPPRPAKRQTTGNTVHHTTNSSYNTPLSMPENHPPNRFQAYTQQQPADGAVSTSANALPAFRQNSVGAGRRPSGATVLPPIRSTFHQQQVPGPQQSPGLLSPFQQQTAFPRPPHSPAQQLYPPQQTDAQRLSAFENMYGNSNGNNHGFRSVSAMSHDQPNPFNPPASSQTGGELRLPLGQSHQPQPHQPFRQQSHGLDNRGPQDGFSNWRSGGDFDYGQHSSPSS